MAFDIACNPASAPNQWAYVLQHFRPRTVYVFGEPPGLTPFADAVQISSATEIPGALVLMAPPNGINYQGTVTLRSFVHPAECCYLFGPDVGALGAEVEGRSIMASVYVETDTTDQMWSWVAAAVAMYDRRVKLG